MQTAALTVLLPTMLLLAGGVYGGGGPAESTSVDSAHLLDEAAWAAALFRKQFDRDGDGRVTLGEAAEGSGGEILAGLWRREDTGAGLRDRADFSCRRSAWRSQQDPSGLVDCVSFRSRVALLAAPGSEQQELAVQQALGWWFHPAGMPVAGTKEVAAPPTTAEAALPDTAAPSYAAGGHGADGPVASILISSDWHLEPWYAADADAHKQPWFTDGVARFANASLDNMMRCADGATGLHPLPCRLSGKNDPPIEHAATHFDAFRRLHVSSAAGAPPRSFFFPGDTQAHLFNYSIGKTGKQEWNFTQPYSEASAISRLMTSVLELVLQKDNFAAEHVYWAPGNHDGPEDATFCSSDPAVVECSLAWCEKLFFSLFEQSIYIYIYINDHFTKTGSGQT
jgi:hypothetical protein